MLRSALRPFHASRLSDGLRGVSTKVKKLRLEDDYWTPNRVVPKYCAKFYPHSAFRPRGVTIKGRFIVLYFFITIIFFLHGLGRLNCSGIDALPLFPGASTISSSSRFVVEGVFRESGVVHYFKIVDPILFVFGSHVMYSRDL